LYIGGQQVKGTRRNDSNKLKFVNTERKKNTISEYIANHQ